MTRHARPATRRRAARRAAARSAIYASLSVLLAADESAVEAVRSQLPALGGSREAGGAVRRAANALSATLGTHSGTDLVRRRSALLPPVESRDLPAYESAYCGADIFRQAQQMADVSGCYRAHGLATGGSRRERPDHIAVELEFMACLTAKEADAALHLGPDQVQQCREAQALFLSEHLGRWSPIFAGRLAERGADGPYQGVAGVLGAWIAAELQEGHVTAPTIADTPAELLPVIESELPVIESEVDGCNGGMNGAWP